MTDKDARELLTYIAKNNYTESKFLTPRPATYVEAVGLLDKIAELRGISKQENGREFNAIADSLEENENTQEDN